MPEIRWRNYLSSRCTSPMVQRVISSHFTTRMCFFVCWVFFGSCTVIHNTDNFLFDYHWCWSLSHVCFVVETQRHQLWCLCDKLLRTICFSHSSQMGWMCRRKHVEPSPRLPACLCSMQHPGKDENIDSQKICDSQTKQKQTTNCIWVNLFLHIYLKCSILPLFKKTLLFIPTVQTILRWRPKGKLWTQETYWLQWRKWSLNDSWSL